MMTRTTALAALVVLGATTLAVAQSTPPTNSMTPSNSSSPQAPSGGMNDDSSTTAIPSGTGDKVGQDPKMKTCMTSEKAKNSGLSEDQVKQKCMMQIASHQGQNK
jgi:hypothetical protein